MSDKKRALALRYGSAILVENIRSGGQALVKLLIAFSQLGQSQNIAFNSAVSSQIQIHTGDFNLDALQILRNGHVYGIALQIGNNGTSRCCSVLLHR